MKDFIGDQIILSVETEWRGI